MQSTYFDTAAAISTVFRVTHSLLESIGAHEIILGSDESAISLTTLHHTERIFIYAYEGVSGVQLKATFIDGDCSPEYTAGQWRINNEIRSSEYIEQCHPLAALAATVVDIAQAQTQATVRFRALTFS